MGSLGDYAAVDEAIVERDSMPRQRLPLEDIALSGTWGRSFRSFQPTAGPQSRT